MQSNDMSSLTRRPIIDAGVGNTPALLPTPIGEIGLPTHGPPPPSQTSEFEFLCPVLSCSPRGKLLLTPLLCTGLACSDDNSFISVV